MIAMSNGVWSFELSDIYAKSPEGSPRLLESPWMMLIYSIACGVP